MKISLRKLTEHLTKSANYSVTVSKSSSSRLGEFVSRLGELLTKLKL